MENFPDLIRDLFERVDRSRIGAVAASGRPRPLEGSYMPVFKAGVNYGKAMAAAFGVPFFEFSHQEGHLAAAVHGSGLSQDREFWHIISPAEPLECFM
jgi:N6-L-threonylcarbamoyladenine synthase